MTSMMLCTTHAKMPNSSTKQQRNSPIRMSKENFLLLIIFRICIYHILLVIPVFACTQIFMLVPIL